MNKNFAVIGLGTFGQQLCESLAEENADVLAIDANPKAVNKVASFIPHALCCDCTREENLSKLSLNDVDHVIIAIGSNIQASILITVLLKELGVKNLIVRVDDNYYAPILKKLGADVIVNPQKLAIQSLSTSLLSKSFTDFYEVTEKFGVAQLKIIKDHNDTNLQGMNIRSSYGINILLIKRDGKTFVPTTNDVFLKGDEIIVFGSKTQISKFEDFLCN